VADPPGGARGRLARGVLLVLLGACALFWPLTVASALLVVAGAALGFAGLREVFEAALGALPQESTPGVSDAARRAGRRVAVVLGLAAVLVAGIGWFGRPRPAPVAAATDACNGAAALCDRTLDEVVFPGTHNSMSSVDITDWMFPQQEKGLAGQLQDGIRAFMLDVHYGLPVEGRVKTDLDSEDTSREKLEEAVGVEGYEAAMRIRDRLAGKVEGGRALYLCHGFCELGATPLVSALTRMHEFLVQNPQEVLILIVEDYVSPQDLAGAFAESGLDGLVYRRAPGPPWPTLREMIDARERVLVLTESGKPGIPWIHPAFQVMQETPYKFKQVSELSCGPNRGGSAGSLLLVNNWIDTTPAPKPSNAAIVNAFDALLARAQKCGKSRGRLPNVIAVDFYRTGDVVKVARALNEQPPPAPRLTARR
jgi:hypothetical protein